MKLASEIKILNTKKDCNMVVLKFLIGASKGTEHVGLDPKLGKAKHQNIQKILETGKNEPFVHKGQAVKVNFLAVEYLSNGCLFRLVDQHGPLKNTSIDLSRHLFTQIMSGIHFMHTQGYYHWNLKPNNFLLDENYNVKITDFGLIDPQNVRSSIGNFLYSAPELLGAAGDEGNSPSSVTGEKADIFSAGIILYYLVSGYLPFGDELCDA